MTKRRSSNPTKNQTVKACEQQELINHLNRIINIQDRLNEPNLKVNDFIQIAAEQLQQLTHATGTLIETLEAEDKLRYRGGTGHLEKWVGQSCDKNDSISGLCISTHQIIRADDVENDPRINPQECRQLQARSLVVVPFFYESHIAGVIKVISNNLNAFSDIDLQTIRVIAGLVGDAIARLKNIGQLKVLSKEKTHALDDLRKTEKKLKHVARHDYLTGLPNRNMFNEQLTIALAKAKRKKQLIALMYLDIDQFKDINDTMGHAYGDKLLTAFANRLKQCLRASDIAARFGGDEFILLLDDLKEVQDAIVIANKILQAMRQPFTLNSKPASVTTSIGIAFLRDSDISLDDFIRQADQALYVSKNSGRNTFYIYDNDLVMEQTQVRE